MQTQLARPLILIYGNSPHLQRVERTLRADPGLRVIQIDPDDGSAAQQLAALGAGVLIYDTAATDPALIQALHTLHPAIPTLGLDGAERSQTRLLGRVYPQTVMAGLEQVLRLLSPEKSGSPRA
ncbi:MAG: hypothetical protein KJZ86_23125 [Caldilineaceae bacterium]|nr:hypothetical protein [Caldilineaceae bacterium]HRJ45313.1 hypothetical protein [Caldilineaceae bacterium]